MSVPKPLTTGQMIPSGTDNPPSRGIDPVIALQMYISKSLLNEMTFKMM
jgi:hypothetical protein